MGGTRLLAIAAAAALSACSGDEHGAPDAGVVDGDAGVDARAPFEPDAPAPPALPILTPCPEGWLAVADDETAPGLVRCDPWPAGGQATCAEDEAHFPGTPGCVVVGTPCGEDDWATDLPEDAEIVYAMAGAVGGNGLRQTPFGDLQHAVDIAAARGAIVALSKGTFDGLLFLHEPVTLWGACTAETILTRTQVLEYGVIVEVGGDGVAIRNLSIRGDHEGILVYELESPLVVDAVIIQGKHAGIFADAGGHVDATNLVVHDTAASDDGQAGYGVAALGGAHVSVTRGVLLRNRTSAASAFEEGSELVLRDVALVGTLPEAGSGNGGTAVEARAGGDAILERVAISDAPSGGIAALYEGTVVDATDVWVRDIVAVNGAGGYGIVSYGARFVGRRLDVSNSGWAGVTIDEPGATSEIEDLVVTDTQASSAENEGAGGVGLGLGDGAVVQARRLLCARNVGGAFGVGGGGASLVAEDVTALDTVTPDGARGMALAVAAGGDADVTRFHAARSTSLAIGVLGDLRLVDALVESTGRGAALSDGWGLAVSEDGEVVIERAIFRDLQGLGLTAYRGGRLTASDVVVDGIVSSTGAASGVLAGEDSVIVLTRMVVSSCEVCGVQVSLGGAIDLHDGEVRDNPIGANVQDPAFDLARLQDRVLYVDNGTPLDTSSLPLPELDP